jgi:hypothetical protein
VFRVGYVVQDSKCISEVTTCVFKPEGTEILMSKLNIGLTGKRLPGNVEGCLTRIDAVQSAYAWGEEPGPATRTTASVEAFSVFRQVFPWEHRCVVAEHGRQLIYFKFAVSEA